MPRSGVYFCDRMGTLRFQDPLSADWVALLFVLVLAQLTHAITFAAHHAACIALVQRLFPGRLRGRGQALYTVIAYGFPGVLGGLVGGVLSSKYGLASVFWSSVATSLIATGCAVKVWRLQHPAVSAPG